MATRRKKRGRGIRYSEAEKKAILRAASKENMTGAQVKKKFGVSPLTYYRWRGPSPSGRGRPRADRGIDEAMLRAEVRARIRKVLPRVIREEVDAYFNRILGRAGRRSR